MNTGCRDSRILRIGLRCPAEVHNTSQPCNCNMQGVVTGVTKQYVTQVRDQLQAMRTAELSLQKVRKNRALEASADGAKPLSDVDKVNAQLFLDAQVSPCSRHT